VAWCALDEQAPVSNSGSLTSGAELCACRDVLALVIAGSAFIGATSKMVA